MPKFTVVERDGKLIIVSESEAEGGPPDHFIAVRWDKNCLTQADKDTAEEFIKDGGKLYIISHFRHGGDWLPTSYLMKEVEHDA